MSRTILGSRLALITGAVVASGLLASSSSDAQAISRVSLRGEFGLGWMLPAVQRDVLGYDSLNYQLSGRLGFDVTDWLSIQASVNSGWFPAAGGQSPGQVLAFQGGLRLHPHVGPGRLWLDVNPGLFLTGSEQRFGFDAGLGYEIDATRWLGIGPMARFHFVKFDPATNVPQDAAYLSFGLSFTLRVPRDEPAPPPPPPSDRDRDGVLDTNDVCPEVPQGASPDPQRPGCPRVDTDHDGVFDSDDLCVEVPAGAHPDPARRGCPIADTDGDGVTDDTDRCVTIPAGPHPDPAMPGCPDGDDDHDAVLNSQDQCVRVAAGLHPDDTRPGCPQPDRDNDSVPDPTDHCPDQPGAPSTDPARNGCPGLVQLGADSIHINRPVYFATGRDVILATSFPVLRAVADALRATPGIHRVSIEGHTDDADDDARNMQLSERRARSVLAWLVANGVEAGRLEAHGFGETRPVQPTTGLRGRRLRAVRSQNRRVEFHVTDPAPGSGTAPAASSAAPPPS